MIRPPLVQLRDDVETVPEEVDTHEPAALDDAHS